MYWCEMGYVVVFLVLLWILVWIVLTVQKVCREHKYIFVNGILDDPREEYEEKAFLAYTA